jgi:magnesium transporter
MLLFKKKRKAAIGARPGTLTESDEAEPTVVRAISYDLQTVSDEELAEGQALPEPGSQQRLWLDVRGLRDLSVLRKIGQHFDIHALALEDVVNVPQRPKAEVYDRDADTEHFLIIVRKVSFDAAGELNADQVSLLLGKSFIASFQETHADAFEPVRIRMQSKTARMRRLGSDYLAYALVDTIVDGYYPVLEHIAERLEALEERVIDRPTPALLRRLQRQKRTLLLLRRAVWPQRDALQTLLRTSSPLVNEETKVYLRDAYDHTVQIADVIESYRDLVSELMNTYLSVTSNKMNEVMKVLTIMASIFIPLTFLAGIYGMNFETIPELKLPWAYPAVLLVMLLLALVMLAFFWKRGWLGGAGDDEESK